MKRKFKLITSIASLTAAVALLAVGAFAAGTRNVDVSGSVSFTALNVDATVTVYEGSALTVAALGDITAGAPVAVNGEQVFVSGAAAEQDGLAVTLGLEALDDDTLVYQYAIKVENDGAAAMWVRFTVEADSVVLPAGITRNIVAPANSQNVTGVSVASGASIVLLVTYEVTPSALESASIPEFTFSSFVEMATTSANLPVQP